MRQNWLQAPHHRLEQGDAFTQGAIYVRFHRAFVVQVDDANVRVFLPQPVDAPDALLHAHGVPRHVVVHHRATELEVQALRGRVRAKQNLRLAFSEAALGVVAANPPPSGAIRGRHFATTPGEAHQLGACFLPQCVAQEVHGVRELGEHHRLAVALLAQIGEHGHQAGELAVWRQRAGAFEQPDDLRALVRHQRVPRQAFQLVGVEGVLTGIVVRGVFFRVFQQRCPAFVQSHQAPLEGAPQRVETAGDAATVHRHHKTDRGTLGLGGLVVGVGDVGLHRLVERLLGRRHGQEAILHFALGDGRTQAPGLGVAAQQLPRVARHQMANRRVRAHQCQGRPTFLHVQLAAWNGGIVAQCPQQLATPQAR